MDKSNDSSETALYNSTHFLHMIFFFYCSLHKRRCCLINSNSYSHFEFTGRFEFLMMVMTHELNIPEKLSPVLPVKIQIYDPYHTAFPLFIGDMCPVWAQWQIFEQLGLVSFESTGKGKDAGRGLKLGARPQSCRELRFSCGPWHSHGKVLKHRSSLYYRSFAGMEMSMRSESLFLVWQ